MADLTIKYKDQPIVELSESSTKTLKTGGKYCEGDISVEYVKPAGGGGGGAIEPYTEETYDSNGNLIAVAMHGHTNIRNKALYECSSLASVTIGNSVTKIGENAFYRCGITSVTIPDSVISIEAYAFQYSSLVSVTIGNSVTSIGGSAFHNCSSLKSVMMPDSVTSIGNYAFAKCKLLESITIPNRVTSIGDYAFTECNSLKSVTIPDSVTSIRKNTFKSCANLTSVTFNGTPSSIASNAFDSCANLTTINVPWAEGAKPFAPWGATNATINYNYTGE